MLVKKFRPMTPGSRQLVLPTHPELTRVGEGRAKVKPTKSLLAPKRRTAAETTWTHLLPSPWWWTQTPLSRDRL